MAGPPRTLSYRTDENNSPTAFITDIAREAGLIPGEDYSPGTAFAGGAFVTARLLHDPVATTIRVIDKVSFYTERGNQRWTYIAIPLFIWSTLTYNQKRDVIGAMYQREGGTAMRDLFPNYGKLVL